MASNNNANDPIVEIFNRDKPSNESNDNDIQVISRDTPPSLNGSTQFNTSYSPDNFDPSAFMESPALANSQLYSNFDPSQSSSSQQPSQQPSQQQQQQPSQQQQQQQQQQHPVNGVIPSAPSPSGYIKDEYALTPNFNQLNDFMNVSNAKKNDFEEENHKDVLNNQLTTINRLQNSLPPLPPLSESVLPSSLNFPQLTLPNLPTLPDDGGSVDKKSIGNGNSNNKKKKENTGPKTRPAFVMKIWSMVNDPSNHEYIRWNDDGKTFQVFHREEFMKVILPKYFKHNNFASFVRQLNMYGWHKVQDISNGTLTRDEKNGEEIWQFKNPNFQRDREDLLDNIIRNKTTNQFEGNDLNNVNLQLILSELDQIKLNQYAIGEDLRRVRKDNKTLWQENFITRERYTQQGQTLDKILKFLAAVYGNSNKSLDGTNFEIEGLDNQMTPYQNNSNQSNQSNNSNSNPYNDYSPIPIRKPRLMLTNKAHQKTPNSDSPANSTKSESIEEIMRSHDQSPKENNLPANNLNRIYNQIVNQDNSIPSPRHYFPELNFPNSPHPNDQTPLTPDNGFSGLEQNIYKQGQSIQQVQDWIQKLASQQQEQQQMLNEQQHLKEIQNDDHSNQDIDGFDVNEFLDNHSNLQSNSNDPVVITPGSNTPKYNSSKRPIEEVYDDDNVDQPSKKR